MRLVVLSLIAIGVSQAQSKFDKEFKYMSHTNESSARDDNDSQHGTTQPNSYYGSR